MRSSYIPQEPAGTPLTPVSAPSDRDTQLTAPQLQLVGESSISIRPSTTHPVKVPDMFLSKKERDLKRKANTETKNALPSGGRVGQPHDSGDVEIVCEHDAIERAREQLRQRMQEGRQWDSSARKDWGDRVRVEEGGSSGPWAEGY